MKDDVCCYFRVFEMENSDMTYWKNYQTAMEWMKGNGAREVRNADEHEVVDRKDEQLEFTIDDDLLDFYRLSRDHKVNRRK